MKYLLMQAMSNTASHWRSLNPFCRKINNNIKHLQFLSLASSGDIECLLSIPLTEHPKKNIAIICHPHPLHDGNMNNKVIFTIAKTLNKHNIPVLRFNFRGVGKSQGQYDEGAGEKDDLETVSKLMRKLYPTQNLWLAGFSFGAYIATSMQQNLQAKQLITVAPAVTSFNVNFPAPSCPWLLIQGLADEVVEAKKVLNWANGLKKPPTIETLENTGHFFHRKLVDLSQIIEQQLFYYDK